MQKDKFIDQLENLVAFKSVSGDIKENSKVLDYILTLIDEKASIKRVKNKNAEILIVANTESNNPDIGYMVHADVVAGKPEQFEFKVEGDKAYGRGTSDMKFSIPIGIELLNTLIQKESKLTFAFMVTTDEETGGLEGGKYLAEEMDFLPKCLIVPDGGDNLSFVDKAKGVCQLSITSKGSPAHASRPWMGKNAINPLVILGQKLISIYKKGNSEETWENTMNIGQIKGGESVNQVCPEAVMKLDFRYPETDSIEKITKTVMDLAEKIDADLQIKHESTGLPTFTDVNIDEVKIFLKAMESTYGKKIVVSQTYGASDARHFAQYNIPVLMMKPMGGEIHSEKEWVDIDSCIKFADGLRTFLEKMETDKIRQ